MHTEIYRVENGQLIKGTIFHMFLREDDRYFLTDLKIYADGFLDCFGPVTMEELERNFKSGRLSMDVPKDNVLFIPYIGPLILTNFYKVEVEKRNPIDIIKELMIHLNREISESDRCKRLFRNYLVEASDTNFKKLKESYNKLSVDKNLFEIAEYKDPLVALFEKNLHYSREQREYLLKDYFEGEWIEIK